MTLRVLLVKDHALMRAGLRLLLAQIAGIEDIAEASDGAEALTLINQLKPTIVLMDIAIGSVNGLEVVARAHEQHPDVRFIILSMYASAAYVRQALQVGAVGYLLKDSAPVELELAIKAVARGEIYLSPVVATHVVAALVEGPVSTESALDRLTPRQRQILVLIAEGHTTQEIARHLQISAKTAEGHRAQLMERLGIHDIPGLVRLAIREGLISP